MARSCRIGLHGRNDTGFHEADYRAVREAKIETLKMMSHTRPEVFKKLHAQNPGLEFITRLYDENNFDVHRHPNPEDFARRMIPQMMALQPYCAKFEVHNEPNHLDRIEGWGQTDEDARDFNAWFLRVYEIIKHYCPWAQLGFPGLAIPHRDIEWIDLCRPAIEQADWLGVHCYWQTPPGQERNHLLPAWGLRFTHYHQRYPTKIIELTEVGNSNVQNKIPFTEASHAKEFTEYLTECFKYPYINSASFFILSSSDRSWDGFTWRSEDGRLHQVVQAVQQMTRPPLVPARASQPTGFPPLTVSTGFQPGATTTSGGAAGLAPPPPLTLTPTAPIGSTGTIASTGNVASGMSQLQNQNTQLQSQLQQLLNQSAQLQSQLEQLRQQNSQLMNQLQQYQTQPTGGMSPVAQPGSGMADPPTPVFAPTPGFGSGPTQPAAPTETFAAPARPAPPIQNITGQLKHHPTLQYPSRPLSQIDRIIIHHTAVTPTVGAERIAQHRVDSQGWPGIGYHYFVTGQGQLQQTNELTTQAKHAGQYDPVAIGVCFAGDFTNAIPTPAQLEAGAQLIAWLIQELNLSPQAVYGYKELVVTQSPGEQWDAGARWGAQLRQKIQDYLAGLK
ncbi:MAG: N-acetylmuramoyl-L-alanine amidase [Anaerolineae bacterium]|nr:N-acetylmuramoyl-L-alanine amidase [Anaerolineae bacterium]